MHDHCTSKYANPEIKLIKASWQGDYAPPIFSITSWCANQRCPVDVLLGEEVPVGAAVLQGHAVAPGAHAVSRHRQRAVVVGQRRVLHHRHVPQESVGLAFRLQDSSRGKKKKK